MLLQGHSATLSILLLHRHYQLTMQRATNTGTAEGQATAKRSRLLAQEPVSTSGRGVQADLQEQTILDDRRTKVMRILFNEILEFRKTHVSVVLSCCETLLKCFRCGFKTSDASVAG